MGLLSPSSDTVARAFTQAGEAWAQILLGEGLNLLSCPPGRTILSVIFIEMLLLPLQQIHATEQQKKK